MLPVLVVNKEYVGGDRVYKPQKKHKPEPTYIISDNKSYSVATSIMQEC